MMQVFHLLHAYLFPTENWCYQMIKHLPDAEITIVTETLRNPEAFPLPQARFVVPPLARDTSSLPWPLRKAVGLARLVAQRLWHHHLRWQTRKADVLHGHFSTMGWQYLGLAKQAAKPLVVSFYGYDYEWIPRNRPEWREHYRVLFDQATLFVTEGAAGRDQLIKQGCRPEKIRVAHLGVDVKRIPFHLRPKPANQLKLVQAATLTPKKGHETTLKAFISAAPFCPGMTLTIVGSDPEGLKAGLQERVVAAGLSERVAFKEFVPVAELHQFLSDFDVFIHPSRHSEAGDSEGGAPIVLLDAQATGLPVLSTRHCDIPEEVIDGKTGLLVDENNDAALAERIREFYEMDTERYATFARNARSHVESNYEIGACARRLRSIYDEVTR